MSNCRFSKHIDQVDRFEAKRTAFTRDTVAIVDVIRGKSIGLGDRVIGCCLVDAVEFS